MRQRLSTYRFPNLLNRAFSVSPCSPISGIRANKQVFSGYSIRPCQEVTLPHIYYTVDGDALRDIKVKVESYGDPSLPSERTIAIFPSFSHSSHAASNSADPSPGWWQSMVGPGKPIDTRHFRVLCLSVLGSPYSPTNPTSINPATGREYRTSFPTITPSDLARVHWLVLKQLGINLKGRISIEPSETYTRRSHQRSHIPTHEFLPPPSHPSTPTEMGEGSESLHAVIGCSMGGMQVLQFCSLFPEASNRAIVVSATGKTTPYTVGIRSIQRNSILQDPNYHRGDYADFNTFPVQGLKAARQIGTIFYRSRKEFDERFNWKPAGTKHFTSLDTWEVEAYLQYQANKFVHKFDANSYLLLSKAMDLMDIGDGVDGRNSFADGASRIKAKTLLIGVKEDTLIPSAELEALSYSVNGVTPRISHDTQQNVPGSEGSDSTMTIPRPSNMEKSAVYVEISCPYGHDTFLKDFPGNGAQIVRIESAEQRTTRSAVLSQNETIGSVRDVANSGSSIGTSSSSPQPSDGIISAQIRMWLHDGLERDLELESAHNTGLSLP